jgi:hypothetical protein
MSDKRESPRRRISAPAVITSGHARVDCTIVDLSPTGARVRLGSGVFLGNDCTIAASMLLEAVASRIVWRRGSEIGLRFKTALRREAGGRRPAARPFGMV